MTDPTKALVVLFNALVLGIHNPVYIAVEGRLYNSVAEDLTRYPQGVPYPFITFQEIVDSQSETFSESFETLLYQFSIFSNSKSSLEVESIYDKLILLLNKPTLSISNYFFLDMKREPGARLIRVNDKVSYWQRVVTYRIFIQKS